MKLAVLGSDPKCQGQGVGTFGLLWHRIVSYYKKHLILTFHMPFSCKYRPINIIRIWFRCYAIRLPLTVQLEI